LPQQSNFDVMPTKKAWQSLNPSAQAIAPIPGRSIKESPFEDAHVRKQHRKQAARAHAQLSPKASNELNLWRLKIS
jgi:hypothetical protein